MVPLYHKSIRLDSALYKQLYLPCSITIGTHAHTPVFTHHHFAQTSTSTILDYALKHVVPLHAFCLMPDHVHLLLEATKEKSIIDVVRELKGLITKLGWKYDLHGSFLQKSFYDHFLRKDEDILTVVYYILNNPVRADLVEHWWEYPYIGSTVYNLEILKGGG